MPRKTLLILSVAINAAFVLFFIGKRIYWTYFRQPEEHTYNLTDYMHATAEIQAMLPIDSADIVFVGNSLTSNFPLTEMFGTLRIKNRGVGSSRITDILERIHPIAGSKPSKLFLEGGVNDLLDNRPVKEVFIDYTKLIDVITDISPSTKLYVQSTCPVVGIKHDVQPGIDSLNIRLRKYCDSTRIPFVDMDPLFKVNGKLNPELTWDGIHLNAEGYRRWYKSVKKYF